MKGQMTIFDFLHEDRDIETISEKEAIDIICRETGLDCRHNSFFKDYRVKVGKCTIALDFETYVEGLKGSCGNTRFIGVDANATHEGFSSPCDSIEEAISKIHSALERDWEAEYERRKESKYQCRDS